MIDEMSEETKRTFLNEATKMKEAFTYAFSEPTNKAPINIAVIDAFR